MKDFSGKIAHARNLRKNMPTAEKILWREIRQSKLGLTFRRQYPIGQYFADFVCLSNKLIIELDGDQHADADALRYDAVRTNFIKSKGFKIIRIPNGYIFHDLESVVNHLRLIISGDIEANDYFKDRYNL